MWNMHMHLGFLLIPTVFHFLFEIMIYVMISVILPEVVKKLVDWLLIDFHSPSRLPIFSL